MEPFRGNAAVFSQTYCAHSSGLATAHKTHTGFAIRAAHADCADHRISNLLITGHAEWFNSVPGHHIFQWFSRPARNFTPVISHLWSHTAITFELPTIEE